MSSGSPFEKGIAIRQPSTALLLVNSSDGEKYNSTTKLRLFDGNPSRIYINNQAPLLFGYMTRLALTEVNIQWGTPNVNEYNKTLTINYFDNANVQQGTVRITIPVGFYTAPLLGVTVAFALNNNATLTAFFGVNTFSIVFGSLACGTSPTTPNITLTTADNTYVIATSSTLGRWSLSPYNNTQVPFPPLLDDLTNMMGLTPSETPLGTWTTLFGGFASLQYTPYIDVISNFLTKNQNVRDGTSSKLVFSTGALARIFLSNEDFQARNVTITYGEGGIFIGSSDNAIGTRAGTLRREFKYPKQIQWNNTENVDIIDIAVLDYRGNPLFYEKTAQNITQDVTQISNTADIQFTLQVTEV